MTHTETAGGWLTRCSSCGAETFHARRPAAEKWAHAHKCPTVRTPKTTTIARPAADWDNREDSTWIDRI